MVLLNIFQAGILHNVDCYECWLGKILVQELWFSFQGIK